MNPPLLRRSKTLRPGLVAVPVGSRRWAAVIDHDALNRDARRVSGSVGHRSGFWCTDRKGGWGTGRTAERAVQECAEPVTYATLAELLKDVDGGAL